MGGQLHVPATLAPGKRPGTHFTGNCMSRGSVWLAVEYLAFTGILSPDLPAQSESLDSYYTPSSTLQFQQPTNGLRSESPTGDR